jgi:hypothetical protein
MRCGGIFKPVHKTPWIDGAHPFFLSLQWLWGNHMVSNDSLPKLEKFIPK